MLRVLMLAARRENKGQEKAATYDETRSQAMLFVVFHMDPLMRQHRCPSAANVMGLYRVQYGSSCCLRLCSIETPL
jgi:hypothetical protein